MGELTEEERNKYFIELWMVSIRSIYKNEFLRPPNPASAGYKHLVKGREICDSCGGEYSDYIKCQLLALQHVNVKPMPYHLATDNARKRFRRYQRKYNKYIKPQYRVDGELFLVTATGKTYQIRDVEKASGLDEIASRVLKLVEVYNNDEGRKGIEGLSEGRRAVLRDEVLYFEAKALYNGRCFPEGFRGLKELLSGGIQSRQEIGEEKVEDVQRVDAVWY